MAISKRLIRLVRNEQTTLALLAMVIGMTASLGVIAFRSVIAGTQYISWGTAGEHLASHVAGLPWWLILIVPTLGGLFIGVLRRFLSTDGRYHAVAEVVEASALHGGRLRPRDGIAAAIGSALTLGVGGSAGREGPVVHMSAAMASYLAQRVGLRRSAAMTLLGCGVASAVATSFNAPIAGVFFALEVVVGHYGLTAFAPVVLASIVGTIITRIYYGDFPAFILEGHVIVSFWELPAFALLGIAAAVTAWLFMRSTFLVQVAVEQSRIPPILAPMCGGLAVGVIAIFLPQVLGVGYEATDLALRGHLAFSILAALVLAKILATAMTLGFGFGGGVFSPSLFVGTMLGGAFGIVATSMGPAASSAPEVYAIVGMAAVSGAVLGAPISTILIVFELTANFDLTIAVMIGTALASLITNHVLGRSYFLWSLELRGVDLSGDRARQFLRMRSVASIMSTGHAVLYHDDNLATIRAKLIDNPRGDFIVLDENDGYVGVLTMDDLRSWLSEAGALESPPSVSKMAHAAVRNLIPGDNLEVALDAMEKSDDDFLPVFKDIEGKEVAGILTRSSLIMAHNRALVDVVDSQR